MEIYKNARNTADKDSMFDVNMQFYHVVPVSVQPTQWVTIRQCELSVGFPSSAGSWMVLISNEVIMLRKAAK